MRKTTLALLAALGLFGCSDDPLAPTEELVGLEEAAALGFAGSFVSDPGSRYLAHLQSLPDSLKLSAEQQAQIQSLLAQFAQATAADRAALAAIMQQAREAAAAGKTREEIRQILAQGDPIRHRLHEAEAALHAALDAVLTAEQKAWLASQQTRCTGSTLSEEQKTQISALVAAFQLANAADLAAIRAAHEQARAAHQAGAKREQIRAILEAVRPAMERVRAAERALAQATDALLTPEQLASGCFRIHAPPGRRH